MMKIYTKTGDDGTTGLFGSIRLPKYHLRIEAYGTVDETNSVLGIVLAHLPKNDSFQEVASWLETIQNHLFVVGGDLATPEEVPYPIPRLQAEATMQVEHWIDTLENSLPPLKSFILPGGSTLAAFAHQARTVCRRAERICVALTIDEKINPNLIPFLNRLSDFFFVLARWFNLANGVEDIKWIPIER